MRKTAAPSPQIKGNLQPTLPLDEFQPERPDLTDWDVILLNTSGGKDSQTMIAEACRQADRAGVPRNRLIAVHANLGRVEWPDTLELVKAQADAQGLELRTVSRPQGDLLEHVEKRGMWPSPAARYCTSDHKRSQISKVVTALDREIRTKARFKLLNVMGLRAAESPARAKKVPYSPNRYFSTKTRTVYDWLPIHDWTDEMVWDDIKASGVPHHPAYDLGMPRLSCVFCIYAPKQALTLAARHNPELLKQYVELERRIDHTFRPELSMQQVARESEEPAEDQEIASWRM
ncbi:MAG: phosphoadenosine phosphosulfate reductase family protein [Dehalococcoidia bacterium]|nr:phosphoadenosine phosphosulfate reductase family protein [Dehalococcoidia bacterium]